MRFLHSLLIFGWALSFSSHAADKPETDEEREAKEAKAEDDAEALLPETQRYGMTVSGTVNMVEYDATKLPNVVIGTFTSDKGVYQLKAANQTLAASLAKIAGKPITLTGKTRNKGKYFICASIVETIAAPVERRKRGGM